MEVRTEEFVGACTKDESILEAYEDARSEFETFGLRDRVDFKIDLNGRWKDLVIETNEVEYLFEIQLLTEKCIEKLRYEYKWFN